MRAPARGYLPNCRMVPGCKAASPCKRGRVKEEGEACSRPWLSSQAVGRHQAVRWLLTWARHSDKKGGGRYSRPRLSPRL